MIKVAPSVLSCNFAELAAEIRRAEDSGADLIHIDVMDGHFVPNITIGAPVVRCIRPLTKLPLDVHLMVKYPHMFIDDFAAAGADMITVHVESESETASVINMIKQRGITAGLSLNPGTGHESLLPFLNMIDLILVMTVQPGFGGQAMIPSALEKIPGIRQGLELDGYEAMISVDGGVDDKTAPAVIKAGADILVAGSYLFGSEDMGEAVRKLKRNIQL